MQTKRDTSQQEMMLLPPLEQFIPDDHQLKRLNRVLNLSFVHEAVRDRYCQTNGRASIDPEVILRIFLLQAITGVTKVRQLLREIQVNLAYRWFIGYRLDEALPDHSTLSKALDRFGDEMFNDLFTRSIEACRRSGLIEGRLLHVDATTIRADIDKDKVRSSKPVDPDARFNRFPDGSLQPGYKQQTAIDGDSRVVLAVAVTPANVSEHDTAVAIIDQAQQQLEQPIEIVCADGAYASGANMSACELRQIRLVSPPPQAKTYTGDAYFTVEDFVYDEASDEFVCPAGTTLRYAGPVSDRAHKRRYRAPVKVCRNCPLRSRCTKSNHRQLKVSQDHGALIRLRAFSRTAEFAAWYRQRAPRIEGVFAECKQQHGLRRAWRRGLMKMRIQCLLIATVINFKRLIAAWRLICGSLKPWRMRWLTRRVEIAFQYRVTKQRQLVPTIASPTTIALR